MTKDNEYLLAKLDPIIRSMVSRLIPENESLLACYEISKSAKRRKLGSGIAGVLLEIAGRNRELRAYAITDSTVIFAQIFQSGESIVSHDTDTVPLDHTISITTRLARKDEMEDGVEYIINLHGQVEGVGVKLEFSAQDEMSQRILKLLQDLLKRKRPTTNQSQSSPAEQLRELVKLHDEGLITDEEFKLKRDRLLEQL